MPYLGTTDPDGWVICDGVLRTSTTDNRYINIYSFLNTWNNTTTNTQNSITPPDLRNRFIYGQTTITPQSTHSSATGNTTVTLTTDQLPSHNHAINISDPTHSHSATFYYNTTNARQSDGFTAWSDNPNNPTPGERSFHTSSVSTGITATSNTTGSGNSINIMPPYVTMNYIIKY